MKRALLIAACLLAAAPAFADDAATGPRIAVPSHDIERGEVIAQGDLVVQAVTPDRVRAGIATTAAQLQGREARRMLRAGEPVRLDDIRMPILVAKGSTVTMTYDLPGISLTASGRAVDEGGMGDTVVVQNPVSFRQVSCVVIGPGQVRAGDATPVPVGNQVVANP